MAGNALYDLGLRLRAAELYDMGRGRASIAALLGIPEETVRKWLDIVSATVKTTNFAIAH